MNNIHEMIEELRSKITPDVKLAATAGLKNCFIPCVLKFDSLMSANAGVGIIETVGMDKMLPLLNAMMTIKEVLMLLEEKQEELINSLGKDNPKYADLMNMVQSNDQRLNELKKNIELIGVKDCAKA